jgi:hypothetical protein
VNIVEIGLLLVATMRVTITMITIVMMITMMTAIVTVLTVPITKQVSGIGITPDLGTW